MLTEGIWLALIVAGTTLITSTIAPVVMTLITARQNRIDRAADWARQDTVAAKLLASNEQLKVTGGVANDKLDAIHTLVNSNMTAAMQAELDATVRELAMMREVIGLNKAAGREPTAESLAAKEMTKTRIAELQATLADRLRS